MNLGKAHQSWFSLARILRLEPSVLLTIFPAPAGVSLRGCWDSSDGTAGVLGKSVSCSGATIGRGGSR